MRNLQFFLCSLRISIDQAVEFPRMLFVNKVDSLLQCTVLHSALYAMKTRIYFNMRILKLKVIFGSTCRTICSESK